MTPQQFCKTYYPFAYDVSIDERVPALFTLAQSALETGWGKTVVGNMMFGVKDTDGVNGNEQLLTTTEYHSTPTYKYPYIYTIVEVVKGRRWKYKVKDWFRKYPTPGDSFRDHARFLKKNPRYKKAFLYPDQPYKFAQAVCEAGYATDPTYWSKIRSIMIILQKYIP